ncbi:hypothetical protein [Nocardia sp. NPDC019395]|uniref:hypothetical protein n=1 Tax=Nocardia sp. NPDC019395 TaxID=3154686 RepID=UPI0033F103E1
MNAPIDQSVLDLLRHSALGPALDRPVNDVLSDMGLGPLPQLPAEFPLPELPPLPALDLSLLAKPLTDLASSFGTGQLPGGAGADPTQVFSQVSAVLQSALQIGASAAQVAMSLWQGMGATEAGNKAGEAQRDGAAISSQSAETSVGTATAATSVFTGATLMSAIVAKYMASLAAATPFLATGTGQVFLLAMTTETLAEAAAVTAKTRTELGIESAKMMETGQKVPVTNAPKGVDPMQIVQQLVQVVPSLMNAVSTGAQSISQLHETFQPVKPIADQEKTGPGRGAPSAAGGAPLVGGARAVGAPAAGQPLGAYPGTRATGGLGAGAAGSPASSPANGNNSSSSRQTTTTTGGMMPMGGGGMAGAGMAGARDAATADGMRSHLVNAEFGQEVVGDIAGVSLPVVGAAERVSEPVDGISPDKKLDL